MDGKSWLYGPVGRRSYEEGPNPGRGGVYATSVGVSRQLAAQMGLSVKASTFVTLAIIPDQMTSHISRTPLPEAPWLPI